MRLLLSVLDCGCTLFSLSVKLLWRAILLLFHIYPLRGVAYIALVIEAVVCLLFTLLNAP